MLGTGYLHAIIVKVRIAPILDNQFLINNGCMELITIYPMVDCKTKYGIARVDCNNDGLSVCGESSSPDRNLLSILCNELNMTHQPFPCCMGEP